MAHARRSEEFQNLLAKVGGAAVLPALVAAVYGANVALPGRDTWLGLLVMLVCVGAGALGGFLLVRELLRRRLGL